MLSAFVSGLRVCLCVCIDRVRNMNEIFEKMSQIGIIPVVVVNDVKDARLLAKALCDGGLPCAEVTFRTLAAKECIRIMSESQSKMLVGAGTVITKKQVEDAVSAGAKFIVSPGYDEEIVDYCIELGIAVIPGVVTPSEGIRAIKKGLDVVKFFPAEAAGGLAMVKAMAAPFPLLKFMPTGGIHQDNVKEYLAFDRILACGGSWMVNESLIREQRFDEVERLAREAYGIVQEVRGLVTHE